MKIIVPLLLTLGIALGGRANPGQSGSSWNGIVPLHSTRADVEQRLGPPESECRCLYKSAEENIFIDYAEAACKGSLYGWNVPTGTVLRLTVYHRVAVPFSALKIDAGEFIKTWDSPTTTYFTSVKEGVRYAVQRDRVVHTEYIPSEGDRHLRCEGFPIYDGGVTQYRPYFSFTRKTEVDTAAYLDQFAFQLSVGETWDGYIIAYAGKVAKRREAGAMAKRARAYLIQRRGIPPRRVTAINGGFRETAEIELYLISHAMPAPTPSPTISPKAVTIIAQTKGAAALPRRRILRAARRSGSTGRTTPRDK